MPITSTQTSQNAANATTLTVTLPASIAAGDLIIVFLGSDSGSSNITWPGGGATWQELVDEAVASSAWASVAYLIASGGETQVQPTHSSERGTYIAIRIAAADWHGTTPPEITAKATGTSSSPNPSNATPSWGAANTLWISGFVADDGGGGTITDVTGFPLADNNVKNLGPGSSAVVAICSIDDNVSSKDVGAFTTTGSDDWNAYTVMVRPAAGGTTTRAYAQAQADIKQVGRGVAQAQADIKQTYTDKSGQAQADIKQTYTDKTGQAQADIKNTYRGYAQAQADIKAQGYGLGQAQADIKATSFALGQAQADIKQTYVVVAQAQALIAVTYFVTGQAQAQIKGIVPNFGQAQADIKQTYYQSAQAQADIKQIYQGYGQAQADIKQTYFGLGQAQADIKQVGRGLGQALALIRTTDNSSGQAQAWIEATYSAHAQSQAFIRAATNVHGQAQAYIASAIQPHRFGELRLGDSQIGTASNSQVNLQLGDEQIGSTNNRQVRVRLTDSSL